MTIMQESIVIPGSGPYGFRLAGGDGRPLTVNKLRRRSKAFDIGLKEADILLGINGFECRTMSHSSAMALLEDESDRLQLSVFRGSMNELDAAYDAMSSSLRPLSPSSLPPPRLLPPPPSAAVKTTGDLIIDQPTFLRRNWPMQKSPMPQVDANMNNTTAESFQSVSSQNPPHNPSQFGHHHQQQPQFPPIAEPRELGTCPPQPFPHPNEPMPTFRVSHFTREIKPWTPLPDSTSLQSKPTHQPDQQFLVSRSVTVSSGPRVWQPTETPLLVRTHAELNVEPEMVEMTSWPTPPPQSSMAVRLVNLQPDQHDGPYDADAVPRWALPLRSEYDWREAYFWADSDEWELAEDGEHFVRKKKIFADSSFYDDPEQKYPTIEEQIKMARRVAQSLTSPGNVKARGQRMFLGRREKADRWTTDTAPNIVLRRVAAARAAADLSGPESDAETLYYNPTPWLASYTKTNWNNPPTGNGPAWMSQTQSSLTSKWKPPQFVSASSKPATPKHTGGNVAPQVAFGLAKDLSRMHDKGSRMFARRRARAAVEEAEQHDDAMRSDIMKRIVDSYVPPKSSDVTNDDEPIKSPGRLMEMIEKDRSRDYGITAGAQMSMTSHPTPSGQEVTRTANFTAKTQTSGFRPVRFKAPIVVSAADLIAEDNEGISDL